MWCWLQTCAWWTSQVFVRKAVYKRSCVAWPQEKRKVHSQFAMPCSRDVLVVEDKSPPQHGWSSSETIAWSFHFCLKKKLWNGNSKPWALQMHGNSRSLLLTWFGVLVLDLHGVMRWNLIACHICMESCKPHVFGPAVTFVFWRTQLHAQNC